MWMISAQGNLTCGVATRHKYDTASVPQVADLGKRVRRKEFQNLAYWAEFFPLTNELASQEEDTP